LTDQINTFGLYLYICTKNEKVTVLHWKMSK